MKTDLITAIKILLAAAYGAGEINTQKEALLASAAKLSRFVDDDTAVRLNQIARRQFTKEDLSEQDVSFFRTRMETIEGEAREIVGNIHGFLDELQKLKRDDKLLIPKAYILIGIPYEPAEASLWDFVREAWFPSR
jgi:hypothetical protein